jgi:beta-1,2-mannobiose phosphorylase / 1,2-beta-oligomannan phosphorylase
VPNYANGCIEDPRLFTLEEEVYMTTACRMFPPGTYWIKDVPEQCVPEWGLRKGNPFGRAAWGNVTVSVLYKVNLAELQAHHYEKAFTYITHLTNPERGENRDVFLFPEKMNIFGKQQYLGLHRPWESHWFTDNPDVKAVSIFMYSSDTLTDFPGPRARHALLAERTFPWEAERVGGSWPPIKISPTEWLIAYHGKQDAARGYSQSFMIACKDDDGFPRIIHRCSERLMYPQQSWELEGRFKTPCLFTCAGIVINGILLMSYGAADEKIGIAKVSLDELVNYIRLFDNQGNKVLG